MSSLAVRVDQAPLGSSSGQQEKQTSDLLFFTQLLLLGIFKYKGKALYVHRLKLELKKIL